MKEYNEIKNPNLDTPKVYSLEDPIEYNTPPGYMGSTVILGDSQQLKESPFKQVNTVKENNNE